MEGCFGAQICALRESPEIVAAISRWASQSAVDAFVRETEAQRAELVRLASAPPQVEHFTAL
jgi:heme-degrading monooxygenase HmoA